MNKRNIHWNSLINSSVPDVFFKEIPSTPDTPDIRKRIMKTDIEMIALCTEHGDIRYMVGFANEATMNALLMDEKFDAKQHLDKSVYLICCIESMSTCV